MSHAIIRLIIHLENAQNLVFRPQNLQRIAQEPVRRTKFTAWFDLNVNDERARELFYQQIPEYFVFHEDVHEWRERERGRAKTIGRMFFVRPTANELYYLKLLVLNVPGATSYDNLKLVNGVQHATFREAAIARGLVHNERHWIDFLTEVCNRELPHQIRFQFVIVLTQNSPRNPGPLDLWERFKNQMSEDYTRQPVNDPQEVAYQKALSVSDLLIFTIINEF
jgi:hypothetical protein